MLITKQLRFALLITLLSTLAFANAATISSPNISGPITNGKHGKAFNLPELDLAKHGYVAEEFFIEGNASAFELLPGTQQGSDGRWQVRRKASAVPYRTRILVVRPAKAKDFNGTVLVHWQNVTAGCELGSVTEGEYLRGYAWVGVSAQKVGIDGFPGPDAAGLKQWDPERYGSLNHPGDEYSYDIFGQGGLAVGRKRAKSKSDPMGNLPVKRVIAAGASQSAGRLRAYINGIHMLDHVFDGYIPYIDFGRGIPFPSADAGASASTPAGGGNSVIGRGSTIVRTDLDVPVFVVNSETESEGYVAARQPNTDKFRFWEVPGSSHVSVSRALIGHPEMELRPGGGVKIGDLESPNWLSYYPVYTTAIRHMHNWLANKKAPPEAPLIEMQSTQPAKIARDAKGNALGGIRLPDFAVASAEHRGNGKTKPGGYRLGFLYGFSREFTDQELTALYPNSAVFLAAYDKSLADVVNKGYLLAEDAPGMKSVATEWARKLDRK